MLKDLSYGVIPLHYAKGSWRCYLVQHHHGNYWGFPKGHPDLQETEQECAQRELKEETALDIIRWLDVEPLKEQYEFYYQGALFHKTVIYFTALVTEGGQVDLREIKAGKWVDLDAVIHSLTYDGAKEMFRQVRMQLKI